MAVGPILAQPAPASVPETISAPAPTRMACLQCQLIGRRKLTCSKADVCKELPHTFLLGPVLLVGWAATVVLFFLAVR